MFILVNFLLPFFLWVYYFQMFTNRLWYLPFHFTVSPFNRSMTSKWKCHLHSPSYDKNTVVVYSIVISRVVIIIVQSVIGSLIPAVYPITELSFNRGDKFAYRGKQLNLFLSTYKLVCKSLNRLKHLVINSTITTWPHWLACNLLTSSFAKRFTILLTVRCVEW